MKMPVKAQNITSHTLSLIYIDSAGINPLYYRRVLSDLYAATDSKKNKTRGSVSPTYSEDLCCFA